MERQQDQRAQQKAAPKHETQKHEAVRSVRSPESSWLSQAILDGASVWDLPRTPLAELAERIGNSNMLALTAMHAPAVQIRQDEPLIGSDLQTEASQVPQIPCQLAPAQALTVGTWPAAASDPGSLE